MTMNIDDERNRVGFVESMEKLLDRVNLTMIISSGMSPYPIEVVS